MIVLLVFILTLLPIATSILFQGSQTVQTNTTDFARGKYDLLVRTEPSAIEKELGLVEENYLGVGNGGITLDEWREIAMDERVEIAAPVASLGFFTKVTNSYRLPIPEGPTRYTVKYETTDGVHTYVIDEQVTYSLFPIGESNYDMYYPAELGNIYGIGGYPTFLVPASYHPVVAIDPDMEGALTGIDFSILNQEIRGFGSYSGTEHQFIPLVDVSESSTPITITITVESLNISEEDILNLKKKVGLEPETSLAMLELQARWGKQKVAENNYVKEFLDRIKATSKKVYKIPAFEYLSPFEQDWFLLDENFNVVMKSDYNPNMHGDYAGVFGYGEEQNLYFRASAPLYQMSEQGLVKVQLVEKDGEIPVHREIEEIQFQEWKEDGDNTALHYFVRVDSISIGEAMEELAASPLGFYQFQYGEHKETGQALQPIHHPGSFYHYLPTV